MKLDEKSYLGEKEIYDYNYIQKVFFDRNEFSPILGKEFLIMLGKDITHLYLHMDKLVLENHGQL